MAMNGFFYADKSIHKLFLNGVKYNFGQQILQIVLSIIITHVMEVILCFLSLTDRYIYEIKALPKDEKKPDKIFDILQKVRIKLMIFFISCLAISLFYWYFISAFCAVYYNTQGLYILDCFLSFIFFSINLCIIYAILALLRYLSLKRIKKKKIKCLYNTSRVFPIF
jgi:Na+/melibiose symporter-like transporter